MHTLAKNYKGGSFFCVTVFVIDYMMVINCKLIYCAGKMQNIVTIYVTLLPKIGDINFDKIVTEKI
jgi:hypothetical protein